MHRGPTGKALRISSIDETCFAFLPNALPPAPAIVFDSKLQDMMAEASTALGRLDGIGRFLPDVSVFIYSFVRKEAILSSQIEGTQSTLSDLLRYENGQAPGVVDIDDVQEASRYVRAMEYGLARLASGFPLSNRLIREMHRELLTGGRGAHEQPGEFRKTQNWIGGTRPGNASYVPPPAECVQDCMGDLERFLHNQPVKTPGLLKAALAHVQFETIHPFLDGNGRIGRLLITLILCNESLLKAPLLYLSLYFKQRRAQYYDLLQDVRVSGNWEGWLEFFLEGVLHTSKNAVLRSGKLIDLFTGDREKIEGLGRASGSAYKLFEYLQKHPITAINRASEALGVSAPTLTEAMKHLVELGVVRELTGQARNRVFAYDAYIGLLDPEA